LEIDTTGSQKIKQVVKLTKGFYTLAFDWAARDGQNIFTSMMSLRFNNILL
jgi:hypothetical protein